MIKSEIKIARPKRNIQIVPYQREANSKVKNTSRGKVHHRRKLRSHKVDKRGDLTKLWNEFCDQTALVGLKYIGGNERRAKGLYRLLWIALWLSQLSLCSWLSCNLMLRYFQYDIKTSTTYNSVNELSFPAITICNENIFRKSMVGGNYPLMYMIASYFAKNKQNLANMTNEVRKFWRAVYRCKKGSSNCFTFRITKLVIKNLTWNRLS